MADLSLLGLLLEGTHAARPAANTVGAGTLFACSDHALIYQSDASSWATWADIGGAGSTFDEDYLPWTHQLHGFLRKSHVGMTLTANDDTQVLGIFVLSSGSQNDEITWDLVLAAGTWKVSLLHSQSTNRGIYTFSLDGSSIGTIDGYNASPTNNVTSTITGISVATTQKYEFKIKMATKNASSSNYFAAFQLVMLNRTA